jgi:hypothetical protein
MSQNDAKTEKESSSSAVPKQSELEILIRHDIPGLCHQLGRTAGCE